MAKETVKVDEQLGTQVVKESTDPPTPETKPRHHVIGWSLIAAVLGAIIWWFTGR